MCAVNLFQSDGAEEKNAESMRFIVATQRDYSMHELSKYSHFLT